MSESDSSIVMRLLSRAREGDAGAYDDLFPLIYDELRDLAAGYMRRERASHTLQPTAIVHEAYMRMVGQADVDWRDRAHFFGAAANTIRRILIDHARTKNRAKRGGGAAAMTIDAAEGAGDESGGVDLLELDEAMESLQRLNERQVQIVEMKFFAGMTIREIASVLGVSERTVEGDWAMARTWLKNAMEG